MSSIHSFFSAKLRVDRTNTASSANNNRLSAVRTATTDSRSSSTSARASSSAPALELRDPFARRAGVRGGAMFAGSMSRRESVQRAEEGPGRAAAAGCVPVSSRNARRACLCSEGRESSMRAAPPRPRRTRSSRATLDIDSGQAGALSRRRMTQRNRVADKTRYRREQGD